MSFWVDRRIAAFKEVRDELYYIDRNPLKDRSCRGKAQRLHERLAELDVTSTITDCYFSWSTVPLPSEIVGFAAGQISLHRFLMVRIPETGDVVEIDPTWDKALAKFGFPVTEWDGFTATRLAVTPINEDWRTLNPKMLRRKYRQTSSPHVCQDLTSMIKKTNDYFQSLRQGATLHA